MIIVGILPLISILRKGGYESGDLSIHSTFAMSFYNSLTDGNYLPRWAGEMYYGYGYPLFIFIYPLPYYIVSFFHFLGFDFTQSVKLLLIFSYLASGIFMYLWMNKISNKTAAFAASVFYLFAPYHLVDTHFRAAIGETLNFAFIPLSFLCAEKLTQTRKTKWFFALTISLVLLILSHQAISLAIFPFLAVYIFLLWKTQKRKNIKSLFLNVLSFVFGILISSFFWLPALYDAAFTHILSSSDIEFPKFYQFFYSPWRFGFLFQGHFGELSFIIGYIQWILIFFAAFLLFTKKIKNNKLFAFFFYSFFIIFILMQPFTKPLWQSVFFLKGFQFAYRLLLLEAFFTSVIAGFLVNEINKKRFVIVICFLAIFPTLLNWGNRKSMSEINDSYLKTQLPIVIGEVIGKKGDIGASASIWLDNNTFKIEKPPKDYLEIINGSATVSLLKRTSTRHEYLIYASKDTTLRENTLYFPGWKLKINNIDYPFDYKSKKYPGIIVFSLAKGLYKADVLFTDTKIKTLSQITSLLSFVGLVLFSIFSLKTKDLMC